MIYIDMIVLVVLIWIVVKLRRIDTTIVDTDETKESSWSCDKWDTTNALKWCDVFTCETKSKGGDLAAWLDIRTDDSDPLSNLQWEEDVKIKDDIISDLTKDLKIYQAYYSDYTVEQLLIFSIAYILEYKMHYKTAHVYSGVLRRFDYVNKTRTCDQAEAAMQIVDVRSKTLLSVIIERQLMHCIQLDHVRYENLMINCVMDLSRLALEGEEQNEEFN